MLATVRFVEESDGCDDARHQVEGARAQEQSDESSEGAFADAVVEEGAVVVVALHAVVARRTVGGLRKSLDVAGGALSVLVEARLFEDQRTVCLWVTQCLIVFVDGVLLE